MDELSVCVFGDVCACKHEMWKRTNTSRLITVKNREGHNKRTKPVPFVCSHLTDFLMHAENTTLENSITGFKELDGFNWFSKCPVSEMNRSAFWGLAFNIAI